MKQITQFKAKDGKIFNQESDCIDHEAMIDKVAIAMRPLGDESELVKDGKGWIQHDPKNVSATKKALLLLARPLFVGHYPNITKAIDSDPDSVHSGSIVGRILDDMDTPINDGWRRLRCIDGDGREHQQPYYAINRPNDDHVCVADRR